MYSRIRRAQKTRKLYWLVRRGEPTKQKQVFRLLACRVENLIESYSNPVYRVTEYFVLTSLTGNQRITTSLSFWSLAVIKRYRCYVEYAQGRDYKTDRISFFNSSILSSRNLLSERVGYHSGPSRRTVIRTSAG